MSSRFRNSGPGSGGFSLIELLIAMAVLTFISFGIYQATVETYRLRDSLMHEGDFHNGIRLSMEILARDVSLIYSPVVMIPPKAPVLDASGMPLPPAPADAQDLLAVLSTDLGATGRFWLPALDKTGIRPSRFAGTDSRLSFVSASHLRIYKNAPESDFAKIAYELREDDAPGAAPGSRVLYRTASTNAFDEDERRDKGFLRAYPLLRGITRFKLRYYRKDKDQWSASWDNEREDFKNLFPDAIELDLAVSGPARLSFEGVYRFRPEVPLRGLDPST